MAISQDHLPVIYMIKKGIIYFIIIWLQVEQWQEL